MYRINRIQSAPSLVIDWEDFNTNQSPANFDSLHSALDAYGAYGLVTNTPEEFMARTFQFTTDPDLSNGNSVGFGIGITGTESNRKYIFNIVIGKHMSSILLRMLTRSMD